MSSVGEPAQELSPTAKAAHRRKRWSHSATRFGDRYERETVERIMDDSLRGLARAAEVEDFVPALAHRFARERLKALSRVHVLLAELESS